MTCEVRLINQRHGKRVFMAEIRKDWLSDRQFNPSGIADAIEGWGTIYSVEKVSIGAGIDWARLYITTTDFNMNAKYLYDSIMAEHNILEAKAAENHE